MADEPQPRPMSELRREVPGNYPRFVGDTPEAQHRWDLCLHVAAEAMGVPQGDGRARPAAAVLFADESLPTE